MATAARIIAATDFSVAADRAVLRAASLASSLSGELHVIHVMPPSDVLQTLFGKDVERETDTLRMRTEKALRERASPLAARFGIEAAYRVVQGRAHEAIVQAAQSLDASLVVVGTRGEHEEDATAESIGGTAFKLLARCPLPTLLVRRHLYQPYDHVVACAKGARTDRAVIEWANRVSPTSLLHVLTAYTVPYERWLNDWGASRATMDAYATRERDERTRQLSELLDGCGLPAARARLHVLRGAPLETILSHAAQWECDLVIVGQRAHAPEGVAGSIARQVASRAAADVLVVAAKRISRSLELMDSQFG